MENGLITGLNHAHSLLRYVLLLLLLIVIYKSFTGKGKRPFTDVDKRLGTLTVLTAHFQLLIGLGLFFLKDWHSQFSNMANVMSNPVLRFFAVEHMVGMLIAILLLTIGNAKAKRAASDDKKFSLLAWFFTIALVIIFISIPWPFRGEFISHGWF